MFSDFLKHIRPSVETQLQLAKSARKEGACLVEFGHLENAHVLGQESTRLHVRVHYLMLMWAIRNFEPREFLGQLLRVIGAATKTAIGLVPKGNTGGSNVGPFRPMPIEAGIAAIIHDAKLASQK